MVIAKLTRTGNCKRFNLIGSCSSDGIRGILGIKTTSFFPNPVMIVASMKWGIILFTVRLVPLQSFGGFILQISMMGVPVFNSSRWDGIPGGSRELRNYIRYCTTSSGSVTVSIALYTFPSPGMYLSRSALSLWTAMFLGARMALSHNQLWSV